MANTFRKAFLEKFIVCYFPSHDHSPGSLPWWLNPRLVQDTSGNLRPLAALRGVVAVIDH